jgi:PhnB protein
MKQSIFLFFDGNCKEAMEFYQSCLGGTPLKHGFPENMHYRVIQAKLSADHIDISSYDWMRPDEQFIRGNMNCMYLSGGNREETKRIFGKLSVKANITDPLKVEPFGYYGALNDQFGVRWMFHAE